MMQGGGSGKVGIFAVLPTVGGQTALNLAVDLADSGVLEKYNVELIGAKLPAIKKAEDRFALQGRDGEDRPGHAEVAAGAQRQRMGWQFASKIGFPVVIRPSFYAGRIRWRHCV